MTPAGITASTLALIVANGRPLSATRDTSVVDPVTGLRAAPSLSTDTWKAVTVPLTSVTIRKFDLSWTAELVGRVVRLAIVAAKGTTLSPRQGDSVVFDGHTWNVFGATVVDFQGTPVLYYVGLEQL